MEGQRSIVRLTANYIICGCVPQTARHVLRHKGVERKERRHLTTYSCNILDVLLSHQVLELSLRVFRDEANLNVVRVDGVGYGTARMTALRTMQPKARLMISRATMNF
jgi:hypothetical protein